MKTPYLLLLLGIVLFAACETEPTATDIHLGTYRARDQLIPYPFIFHFNGQNLDLHNHKGEKIDEIQPDSLGFAKGDTLFYKDHHFKVGYINAVKGEEYIAMYDLLDTLTFPNFPSSQSPSWKSWARVQHLYKSKDYDLATAKNILQNSAWSYQTYSETPNNDLDITQTLFFTKDSLHQFRHYGYGHAELLLEYEVKGYHLMELDGVLLLALSASVDNPQPIFQLTALSKNKVTWNNFTQRDILSESLERKDITLKKFKNLHPNAKSYANCFDGYQAEYYYANPDITYLKGNDYLVSTIGKNAPRGSGDGYIIVHYNVNCQAKTGRFGLLQMDKKFESTTFSDDLVGYLIKEVAQLKDWANTISDPDFFIPFKDVHGFLMFKIESGKITDVSP